MSSAGRNGGRGRRFLAVALAGALAVASTACGDDEGTEEETDATEASQTDETVAEETAADLLGPDDPATGEPVLIGLISDGATAAFDNTDELRAGQATAEYFNAHQGGVGGRPIELVTCETAGTPEGATDCANQMIEAGVAAVTLSQSAVTGLLWETLHPAGIPTWFTQASGEELEVDEESTFIVFNPDGSFFGLPVATAEADGVDKIAFVVIDVPQAVEILEGPGAQLLEDAGLEFEVIRVAVGTADMTTQMQQVVASGAGVVQVIGNDAFCIAAFQGLEAVAYEGSITAITQCVTDATREAMPGGLEGINLFSTLALGATDDPSYELYQAIMTEYGDDVTDIDNLTSMGGYAAVASLATALQELPAEVTPEAVIETIRSMPESEYPGGAGVTYQCGIEVDPDFPPVCTNQWLRTQLDADGNPTTYTIEDSTELVGG
jgi:branched-chain amino acid transport system substrate-binding protein